MADEANEPNCLRIIPLGGVMEIGKNMTAYDYRGQILVVDCGLAFPDEEMLGVDIVIPDITYLEENSDRILGIVLTHGHEDHIGAMPYVLRRIDVPIWGTSLTLGFVSHKLSEHRLLETTRLNPVSPGDKLELGPFNIEFLRVSHSIPGALGLIIKTPVGTIAHTGDFKFDQSPVDGHLPDFGHLAIAGEDGVLAFLCDVTNVERRGTTASESTVGESFDRIFANASGRIVIAAFASNIHRVQQVYNVAANHGRRVAVIGRSMAKNCRIAEDLGYLKVPASARLSVQDLDDTPASETVIITTGSQGEPLSALTKMAQDEHKNVSISEGDTVIISASPIPGNENLVNKTINRLFRLGARVVYEPYTKVHASGHGSQEDIRLMVNLLRPKFIIPVHGEQRHVSHFCDLAETMGYPPDRISKLSIGDIWETDGCEAQVVGHVTAGSVMIDGIGIGDVEDVVLRDRTHLAQDGVVVAVIGRESATGNLISGPDIFSKGFAVEERADELIEEAKFVVLAKLEELSTADSPEPVSDIKAAVRKALAKFLYDRTHRRPMIVPIVMEV